MTVTFINEAAAGAVGIRVNITARNGRQIPVLASASVIRNSAGDVIGGFELVRDISKFAIEEQVKKISSRLLDSCEGLVANSEETTVVAEQMSKGIYSLAEDTTKVAGLATETGKLAQEGGDAILKTLKTEEISASSQQVAGAAENVAGLSDQLVRIGK